MILTPPSTSRRFANAATSKARLLLLTPRMVSSLVMCMHPRVTGTARARSASELIVMPGQVAAVGDADGPAVGAPVGETDGIAVGAAVGLWVGLEVASSVATRATSPAIVVFMAVMIDSCGEYIRRMKG